MRLSAKSRYGLAAMTYMAQLYNNGEYITISNISETLGVSKVYLEQTFALLKRAEIVISIKGAQGGYRLSRSPDYITVLDILSSIETSLFEKTEETVADAVPSVEKAMQICVFDQLSNTIEQVLEHVTLQELVQEAEKQRDDNNFMFFI